MSRRRATAETEGPLLLDIPESQRWPLPRARVERDRAAAWLARRKGFLSTLAEQCRWEPEQYEGLLYAALRQHRDCRAFAAARRLLQFARLVKAQEAAAAPPRGGAPLRQPSPLPVCSLSPEP